jgi:hypothetical protein
MVISTMVMRECRPRTCMHPPLRQRLVSQKCKHHRGESLAAQQTVGSSSHHGIVSVSARSLDGKLTAAVNRSARPTTMTACGPRQPCCALEHRTWSRTPSPASPSARWSLAYVRFASGIYGRILTPADTYTINAISQDEFDDVIVPDAPMSQPAQQQLSGPGPTQAVQQAVDARRQ